MAVQLQEDEIENALKARLGNGSLGYNIAWPNRSKPEKRPLLEVSFPEAARQGGALAGAADIEIIEGMMAVIVVVDNDTHTTEANNIADQVATLFPEGTKISITNGEITLRLPDIKKGFEGNGQWRTPVMIPYSVSRV